MEPEEDFAGGLGGGDRDGGVGFDDGGFGGAGLEEGGFGGAGLEEGGFGAGLDDGGFGGGGLEVPEDEPPEAGFTF